MKRRNNEIIGVLIAANVIKPKVTTLEEKDALYVIRDTFRKHGFDIGAVQITAIGDSYEVAIDNVGEGQLSDNLDYHNEWFTRPAMEASVKIGQTTDYILADTRPVLKEGYPGGVQKFIYWFKRKDSTVQYEINKPLCADIPLDEWATQSDMKKYSVCKVCNYKCDYGLNLLRQNRE